LYPFERFTEGAKKVLTLAQEEAERSHHNYIGTEHLLLGILRVGDGPGYRALRSLNIEVGPIRRAIQDVIGRNERVLFQQIIPTSRVKKVIEIAFEESRRRGHNNVDSGHLLIALVVEGEGIAAKVLEDLGATAERVISAVEAVMEAPPTSGVETVMESPPAVSPREPASADADSERFLRLLNAPHFDRWLRARGLDIDRVVEELAHPPKAVVDLRAFVAHSRAELKAAIDRRDFDEAARQQRRETELLARLMTAEQAWLDSL
jgi:ATP-dependent Clp protease ATP-binding subunit ClpA